MKKISKTQKIKEALLSNEDAKSISKRLRVPIQSVYTVKWKLKKKGINPDAPRQRIRMTDSVKKELENYEANTKLLKDEVHEFIKDEISWIDNQIEQLRTIRAFLAIREAQLKPDLNG